MRSIVCDFFFFYFFSFYLFCFVNQEGEHAIDNVYTESKATSVSDPTNTDPISANVMS